MESLGNTPLPAETSFDEPDEHELIARAQQEDYDAFDGLYTLHAPSLKRQVRAQVLNKEDAEDITHETFIRAYRRLEQFEDRGNGFRGYLGRIADNLCIDHARQRKTRPETVSSEQGEQVLAVTPGTDDAEHKALEALSPFSPKVQTALDQLKQRNPDFYHAAMAVYIQGKQYQEYADETGLPLNTVRTRVLRAKQKLRDNIYASDIQEN